VLEDKKQQLEAATAALGSKAKSITPSSDRRKIQEVRAQRYELLSVARKVFIEEGTKERLEHAANYHRTAKCRYIAHGGSVGVHRSKVHSSAFYTGLQTCGSVWTCPVCAAKIQERRRIEIASAIDWCYANDMQAVLVTLTFPHTRKDELKELLTKQSKALQRLRAGQPWSRFKNSIKYRGLIRSLELTYGTTNGWHPHVHELWFIDKSMTHEDLLLEVTDRWYSACKRADLIPATTKIEDFYRRSVDIKMNCSASDYLAKQDSSKHWGVDRELSKASSKSGKMSGAHPFLFLAENSVRSKTLFIEYAKAIKGKSQLFWSAGLKKSVGLQDKSDEEISEEDKDEADLLGLLNHEEWVLVRTFDRRSDILDLAENNGDWESIQQFLAGLKCQLSILKKLAIHPR